MGNSQSTSSLSRATGALDSFVADIGPDLLYEKSIGSARFLKTAKCKHRAGFLAVKIFIKPDPGFSLSKYHRRMRIEREALLDIPNVYSYQTFIETEKAGYLIRQWAASSLYDRISTRPFLSTIEKRWIAFQLINAMRDARNRKVLHGDIKSENILVTSWNWVYLTDFASYKPTYLPLDDPADFSYFFDTSGKRNCYIAPERFYAASANPGPSSKTASAAVEDDERKEGSVTEAMDCFSLGCVIAELFRDGKVLFSLSQLFKYREGDFNVESALSDINDAGVVDMVKQMISLNPEERPSFETLLHTARGVVFPECFYSYLHYWASTLNETSPQQHFPTSGTASAPASSTPSQTSAIAATNRIDAVTNSPDRATIHPNDSDRRVERIWAEYESLVPYFSTNTTGEELDIPLEPIPSATSLQDLFPVELNIPNREEKINTNVKAATEDGPALIILAFITANIRNCRLPSSKIRALDVCQALSAHLTDEAKLDRMVPYIVDLLHDEAASVRGAALRTLVQVLMVVSVIAPSNAAIFPEYILPNLRHLVSDPEVFVRCMYAQSITHIADTAVRYLEMGQALRAHGAFKLSAEAQEYGDANFEVSYESSISDLQGTIQEHLSLLLMDSSSVVKRAVLHNISPLCSFLGRTKANDVLLSHMMTYLNDKDWLLRYAFFDSIVSVAACAGGRSLEEYILPLTIQAFFDVEESVVVKVLGALTSLCELGLFQKMRIWELMSATLGFLFHPNIWIRQGAASFLVSAAKPLPPSDVWCILYPSLKSYLRADVKELTEFSLLMTLKPPLPRPVFDGAVQWAMKAGNASFWRTHRHSGAKTELPRESAISFRKSNGGSLKNLTEDDDANLKRLQSLGMTPGDESKLSAMRDYILKLASNSSSFGAHIAEPDASAALKTIGDVEVRKLGIMPQTVFLKSRPNESLAPPSLRSLKPSGSALDLTGPRSHTSRNTRKMSFDQSGAPYEDLRRRLASINDSATSLNTPIREGRLFSPLAQLPSTALSDPKLPTPRPATPAESITSMSQPSAFRPTVHRLHIGGADGQKAAPAVGSSMANAIGVVTAHTLQSPQPSGRSSPASVAGTVRGSAHTPLPISTYDGHEPAISNILENLYLGNNRELLQDFGPKVHEGPVRRRNAGRQGFISRDSPRRKLDAQLLGHLTSHSDSVTGLAVSPDHLFFVSSSDDKTVKIWDTARLERNVTSKPRHTYGQHHAKVKCVCMLQSVHCFASAGEDGSLHVVRVHVSQSSALPKYSKLQLIRERKLEQSGEYITCMSHYLTDSTSNLVYATSHSSIVVLDLLTMQVLQSMENPRHHGPITCLCIDPGRTWVVIGTSSGVLSLWDLRFGLLLRSWHVGAAAAGRPARVHQCIKYPVHDSNKCTRVMVSMEVSPPSGSSSPAVPICIVEVWDIETAKLTEVFMTRWHSSPEEPVTEPYPVNGVEADRNPASAIAMLVQSRQKEGFGRETRPGLLHSPSPFREETTALPSSSVRALVTGVDFGGPSRSDSSKSSGKGFMLSGSDDAKIRLWDLGKVDRTTVLSGLDSELERPTYSTDTPKSTAIHVETCPPHSTVSTQSNRPPQRISMISQSQQKLLKPHQDVITCLACIDSPFRGGIVSGDRSGTLKVWRVESMEQ